MDIKDFIKETLTQIVEGITDANKEIQGKGAFIVSSNLKDANGLPARELYSDDKNDLRHIVREISFDISIVVSDSEQSGVKGGLQVFSFIHSDGGIENNTSSSSMHKIKFSLPLAMPI